ncbi:hypothetical protein GCM10010361_60410 [Streptomyces olivaceiscleroticus]|uniref:Uncharacterized protein n=1 Tax=Streptomyces olivaceiscleroticus TaxID=68245 RepID=A0ABN1AZZ7_9ACTN
MAVLLQEEVHLGQGVVQRLAFRGAEHMGRRRDPVRGREHQIRAGDCYRGRHVCVPVSPRHSLHNFPRCGVLSSADFSRVPGARKHLAGSGGRRSGVLTVAILGIIYRSTSFYSWPFKKNAQMHVHPQVRTDYFATSPTTGAIGRSVAP